jgi:hypothetical protein
LRELVKPRYLVAVTGAVVVVGAVLAAVLGSDTRPAPAASPGVGAPGSSLAVDPAACPLPAAAPAASPSGQPSSSQAAFDDAGTILLAESSGGAPDEGSGRLRLCVDGVDPIDIGIGCLWSVDRTSVDRIGGSGDRSGAGGGLASVVLELTGGRSGDLAVGLASTADPAGEYRSIGPARTALELAPAAASGIVRFADLPFQVNTAGAPPPANQPPSIAGALRWSCDPAPAPVAGVATGQMSVRLDLPVGQQLDVRATCQWGVAGGRQSVTSLAMRSLIAAGGGKAWSLGIAQLGDPPLPTEPDVSIYLSTPDGGDSYVAQAFGAVIVAEISPASRQGRLRFQGLAIPREAGFLTLDGTEATRTLAGIVSWSCDPPLRAPEQPGGVPPLVRPLTRSGTATLAMNGVLEVPQSIPVSCRVHDNPADPGALQIDGAEGRFSVGDETVRLIVNDGSLVLFRTASDGRILGEYTTDEGSGPVLGGVDEVPSSQSLALHFRPVDPAYSPFLGEGGPRDIEATLTVDCRDPNA